jgi:hypothetical protein
MRRLAALLMWIAVASASGAVLAATVAHNQVPQFSLGVSDGIAVTVGSTKTPP